MPGSQLANSAELACPGEWTLPDLIVQRAAEHPSRPAIVSGTSQLTYDELAGRATTLAERLRRAGAGPEVPVASCLPRSLALATSVLGIWLARAAYVPIDPEGPSARFGHILADSDPPVMVADVGTRQPARLGRRVVVRLDKQGAVYPGGTTGRAADDRAATGGPPGRVRPEATDLAYVIYTSGSTGLPKGVLVEHQSLATMAASHERIVYADELGMVRLVALNSVVTTDTFFSDFANLAFGRTLFVVDEPTRRDPDRLASFVRDTGIEVLDATPSQIRSMVAARCFRALESLKILILGGEPIDPELWERLRSLREVRVYNMYGPTECTVDVTAAVVSDHESPVIGTEFPGCQVLIADETGRLLPDGQIGELWVAGPWVARGYLHPNKQDARRFALLDLRDGRSPMRAYRTGDLARRNAAGQLEFLGRTDDQVSIDGYRIELGEVRTALRSCTGVREAAVGLRHRPQPELVAWVVLTGDTDQRAVRSELMSMLPRQAIPALIAVPAVAAAPDGVAEERGSAGHATYAAAAEQPGQAEPPCIPDVIRAIWCEVLEVPSIEQEDDFFELGGNSLKGTTAIVAIREAVAADLPIRTIFDFPEFGSFCAAVRDFVSSAESS